MPIPISNKDATSKICSVFVFPFFESQIPNIISVFDKQYTAFLTHATSVHAVRCLALSFKSIKITLAAERYRVRLLVDCG